MFTNKPYIKDVQDINGELVVMNPIVDDTPYLHFAPNRRARRAKKQRPHSNKKGIQLIITKVSPIQLEPGKTLPPYFAKIIRTLQPVASKTIYKEIKNNGGVKSKKVVITTPVFRKSRTITHNEFKN